MSLISPVTRAGLRSSGRRLIAAGITVAISVAFIVAGLLMVDSLTRGITAEAEADAAGTDLIITTDALVPAEEWEDYQGDPDLEEHADEPLIDELQQLPSVASAEPIRSAHLASTDTPGGYTVALQASQFPETMDYTVTTGREPESADEVLISETAAEIYDLQLGETLAADHGMWEESGAGAEDEVTPAEVDYEIVGIAELPGAFPRGYLTGAGVDRLPVNPTPEQIRVVLPEGDHGDPAAQEAVQQEIAQLIQDLAAEGELSGLIPEGGQPPSLRTAEFDIAWIGDLSIATNEQIVDQWIYQRTAGADVLTYLTLGFGGIAVFVSALVIANTFQVLVAGRQRTMALLRTVGASAAQLRRATLTEGAVLGVVAGAAGVLLGVAAAFGLTQVANAGFDAEMPQVVPTVTPAAVGLGLGLAMSVLAAAWPAVRAGRVSPMAALRPADTAPAERRTSVARISTGVVLLGLGAASVLYAALTSVDIDTFAPNTDPVIGLPMAFWGSAGALVAFLGVLVLARIVVPPLVAGLGRALAALPPLKTVARLAGQNARQVPGRTAATASALLVGTTLVITMVIGAATAERMIYAELAETYPDPEEYEAAEAMFSDAIDTVLMAVLVLLAASVIVAVIGVSNTLSLSVVERRREAALLRAVGMSRRSAGRMISVEALLTAAVALILGTALGIFFGWAGVATLIDREDWNVVVDIPLLRLAAVWAVTLLAALMAAWLPARRMSRVQPAAGLAA